MGRTREAKAIIVELKKSIEIAEHRKKYFEEYLHKLWNNYQKGLVSRDFYVETAHRHFDGKTLKEWIDYYKHYIKECEKHLGKHKRNLVGEYLSVFFFSALIIFVVFMASIYIRPELTGFLVQEAPGVITYANATIITTQQQAILGQPVKWTKTISLDQPATARIRLPREATNIFVTKIKESYSEETEEVLPKEDSSPSQEEPSSSETSFSITGAMISSAEGEGFLSRFFRNLGKITGRAIDAGAELQEIEIDNTATEYEVEYETPAPYAIEEDIEKGKRVKIIGPGDTHYQNVLAFTELNENLNIKNPSRVKIYWVEDNSYIPIENIADLDNNGIYDYIEWVAPRLSNQTFEIIVITKAEHLNSERNFISNIYDEVKELDDVWSETISDDEYVRVTFEIPLDPSRDITIYPRITSGTPKIEVYEIDSNELIAEFTTINDNQYNKVFLTGLNGTQDTFDLKIINGEIELDHVIDPSSFYETGVVEVNGWTIVDLKSSYDVPVVVAYRREGAEIDAAQELITAIIENVSSDSFKINFYDDYANEVSGNASYIVVENGSHVLDNGMLLQAGLVEDVNVYDCAGGSGTAARTVTFHTAYSSAPSVIANVQNNTESDWIAARYDSVSTTQVILSMERDELEGSTPLTASSNYNIGWITMNQTSATDMEGGIDPTVTADPTDTNWETQSFSNTYTTALFFALVQQGSGTDPTTGGTRNLGTSSVDLRMTESRTDGEQTHADEPIMWMVFESDLGNNPPTTPTNITCDGSNNCNVSVNQRDIINLTGTGSNDPDGDDFDYTIEASLLNTTISNDQESGTSQAISMGEGVILGEQGELNVSGAEWHLIAFDNTYTSTPIVIATPATSNEPSNQDYSPLVPAISLVNTTHFNITLCMDNATQYCTGTTNEETIHYFVFDVDKVEEYDWIDAGTISAASQVDAKSADISFSITFSDIPYLFTTAQTYNQGGNISQHQWVVGTTTSETDLYACTHQAPALGKHVDDCDSGLPAESVGWVAIDPTNHQIDSLQIGTESIDDSLWTGVSFSPTYTDPMIMVTQNSESGGQDPQYPMARLVTSSGADIKYCEADTVDMCNSHNAEDVRWFAIEKGDTTVGEETTDIEAIKNWTTYNNVFSSDWKNLTSLNVNVSVSVYNNSGSLNNNNNNPDLQLQMYNGSDFVEIGNFSVDQTGNFNLTVTDSTVLTGWQTADNTNLKIRGVNFDYNSSNNIDEINWTEVWININGTIWTVIGNHTNGTGQTFEWNTTDVDAQTCIDLRVRAKDLLGSNSFSDYFTKNACLNITTVGDDTTPPYFTTLVNQTSYDNENLNYDINATDDGVGLDSFSIDDTTNFSINPSTGVITNITTLVEYYYVVNVSINDTVGNLNWSLWSLNVTEVSNVAPTIEWVQTISAQDPSIGTTKSIIFNFTATDINGINDIDNSTAAAYFQRAGEITRSNNSCLPRNASTNSITFTCTIDMWYWDENGAWTINATIQDNSAEYAKNSSETFTYNILTAMVISPTEINWPEINLPDTDTGSNDDPITINNSGNAEPLNINITAYNLQGEETTTQYIYANNFTVGDTDQGCSGTAMVNATSTNVTSVVLHKGNHSLNYNNATSGQEQIYFCLKGVPQDISSQSYSSTAYGAWEIKILLVAVIYAGRRKKKRKKKKGLLLRAAEILAEDIRERYSEEKEKILQILIKELRKEHKLGKKEIDKLEIKKEIEIPITIFSEKLGVLEALVKYTKENLNRNYSRIAKLFNRDQRTIWTAYFKATEKEKKKMRIKKTDVLLPVSIFRNRRLTALASVIMYLKKKSMKFSEIAELLNRDQRNIWAIYSRAVNQKLQHPQIKSVKKEKRKMVPVENSKIMRVLKLVSAELKKGYSKEKEIASTLLIRVIRKEYRTSKKEVLKLIREKENNIPITIFSNKPGALESLVKYMKENLNMNYKEIAEKLGRNERTVWTSYSKATKKMKEPIKIKKTEASIPLSKLRNKNLTILESLIKYLKEKGMKYSEIAKLLERDQRNIWTIYSRAKKKLDRPNKRE